MKVVIIGGGIAGLTLGIILQKRNIEVVVNERFKDLPERGHAFLMHKDGLSILKDLQGDKKNTLGSTVDTFTLKRPSGEVLKKLHLDSWKCIKRIDLVNFLTNTFNPFSFKKGRTFSHFLMEGDNATAAVFENGDVEYGDIFVGADGANSLIRASIFDKIHFTGIDVKEIVGIVHSYEVAQKFKNKFTKYQHKTKGLAFGFIPTSDNEVVWFMQYDTSLFEVQEHTAEKIKSFCYETLIDFPDDVKKIISLNDYNKSYIWNTRDIDLLPSFHKHNIVLIGDAAHLSLPFTSAGTTNAIKDARALADILTGVNDLEAGFQSYYQIRSKEVLKHINLGREIKATFLRPGEYLDDHIPVPLIAQKENEEKILEEKEIQILYFTDPICSTCWVIQPLILKLKMEYGKYIHIRYCMGGMLPTWEEYPKGKISNPLDAGKYWEEVSAEHEMPLDGDIWHEDPLHSSYPPSIAFKAAQMQDNHYSLLFLRRIKEMVFIEKKNITKWEYLEQAAFEVGLDTARMLRDFNGKAKQLFKEDLILGKEIGIRTFPTFIFTNKENKKVTIKGYHEYQDFENIIKVMLPDAKKEIINTDPKNLFGNYPTMAEKEFAYLSDLNKDEAVNILSGLENKGLIEKYETKNGVIWKSKFGYQDW